MDEKPQRKRVCHTCAISMDNILVETIRHSAEMSFNAGDGGAISAELAADIVNGRNPVLARSFEAGIKESGVGALSMSEIHDPKFNMPLTMNAGGVGH
jgi:hypothetical protein